MPSYSISTIGKSADMKKVKNILHCFEMARGAFSRKGTIIENTFVVTSSDIDCFDRHENLDTPTAEEYIPHVHLDVSVEVLELAPRNG